MKSRLGATYMNLWGAHSGPHGTGGNRNGYSRGAKCTCRQFDRSAKSDSSRLRRVG